MFRRIFHLFLSIFCQYNSISGQLAISANYARSWTWPCNCCSFVLPVTSSSVLDSQLFFFPLLFSSYIIGKWQCQKLVANAALTISENSFGLVSQVTQVWKECGTIFQHIFNQLAALREPLAAKLQWLTLMAADDKRNAFIERNADIDCDLHLNSRRVAKFYTKWIFYLLPRGQKQVLIVISE